MTDDERKRIRFQARTMAAQIMIAHSQSLTAEALQAFGAGLVEGIRDVLTAHASDQVAYETTQAVADAASVPMLKAADTPL